MRVVLAVLVAAGVACSAVAPRGAGSVPTSTPVPSLTPARPATARPSPAAVAASATPSGAAAAFSATPGPTPLPPTATPTALPATGSGNYTAQSGDTLAGLAARFRTEVDVILARNPVLASLPAPRTQTLPPGLPLDLPDPGLPPNTYATPLLPDSEVVYSPAVAAFDVRAYVLAQPGFLASYSEVVTYTKPAMAGWEIVADYARRYSINPRLLLALLEMQSGALSNPAPEPYVRDHPLLADSPAMLPGLSHQMGWASSQLTYGYYGWRAGEALSFATSDNAFRAVDGRLNAGTYAVARLLALLYPSTELARVTGPDGLTAVYRRLFGDPFSLAYEPLIRGGLSQPAMQLPFERGAVWAFTGGPHAAYGRGLPLAALDFGPEAEVPGCVPAAAWITAVAAGVVSYSHEGLLELDLGGGWSVAYLHIATLDRAPAGTAVQAGDRLGHPSCEGGRATASHVHLSRKYNGEWVPADTYAPFVLSGWVAHAGASAYLGTLTRGDRVVEACACAKAYTEIWLEP